MVAIAIFSADPLLRRSLEQLLRGDPTITVVGVASDPTAVLSLIDRNRPDAILAHAPSREQLADWRIRRDEIVAAINAATHGLAVLPHELLPMLLEGGSLADGAIDGPDAGQAPLTPRELEVLAAMADGASNKTIARRLGISFHTVKFHVAAILTKLNAESRTEAVTRAAQLGLVML